MDSRRKFGNTGESLAEKYLIRNGYKIIEKQWQKFGLGEIDIIAEEKGELVFVEVKTRTGDMFGEPEEAVTFAKRSKINRLIEAYLQEKYKTEKRYRFDVVAIVLKDQVARIRHIKNVGI